MSAPTLADYLAAYPDAPAALTPDALGDFAQDLPADDPALAAYAARLDALTRRVTAASLLAAAQGGAALDALGDELPRLPADAGADAVWDTLARIVAPDRTRPTVDALTFAHGLYQWAARAHPDEGLKHPAAPLIRAYLDATRPAARPDRWPRATMPRLVTTERAGAPARIQLSDDAANAPATCSPLTLPGLGPLDIPDAPALAYLPGFERPDAPAGVIPAAWLALIDGFAGAHPDAREWQRALRLLIEVVSAPDPRERRGTQRVYLPVGGPDGIVRRLWPNDAHVRAHYPALRRALGLAVSAALPASDGRAYLPAQLDRWQRPDALTFNVTYPDRGGGGAAYDRAAMRRYGVHPRLLRVYLAAVWALDAPGLQVGPGGRDGAALALDALADLAAYPDVPRDAVARDNARRRTLAALDRMAADGVLDFEHGGRGRSRRLTLWTPRPALPPPDDADCG